MAGQYPLEALLRPAVELYTTTVCFTAAALCIVAPWTFALTPLFGIVAALGFAWLGIVRLKQAGVVLRYRRNIRRLPKYTMTSAEMPVSNEHLFIGKGFRWTQKHTQRLVDTYLPQFASYVEPSPLYERARRLEKQLEFAPFPLKLVAKATAWDVAWNPARPLPPVGGLPRL
ncbi:conjugative coupling factor TraD, PFGI-1 class, partial [Pseudomonas aeruginosa]|nr:conjugative coupling factor TraD, PFGI-1 class [Pseudomonas aeruginosa]